MTTDDEIPNLSMGLEAPPEIVKQVKEMEGRVVRMTGDPFLRPGHRVQKHLWQDVRFRTEFEAGLRRAREAAVEEVREEAAEYIRGQLRWLRDAAAEAGIDFDNLDEGA